MFVDEAKILVIGGNGGNGCCSFRREKYVPHGGPDGGDGGHGGDVIFESDEGESTLLRFRYASQFVADRGRHGEGSDKTGRSGGDRVVPVPVGTVVYDEDRLRLLADLCEPGQRFVAARGGRGGRGNPRFKSSVNRAPTRADPGQPGEQRRLRLELKLLADVGLLGFPNAGKSTLISRVSAARPKIAAYPFTTLVPNLGVVDRGDYRSYVIADIPGLIDGAHEGAGLGLRFLRHVERCRLLLHLVDLSDTSRSATERLEALDAELAGHDPRLAERPQIVVGTKIDAAQDDEARERLTEWAARHGRSLHLVSAVSGEGIDRLVRSVGERLDSLEPLPPLALDDQEVET